MSSAEVRILVVLPPFEVYGPANGGAVSTVAQGLAQTWTRRGHDMVVATAPHHILYPVGRATNIDFPRQRPLTALQRVRAGAQRRLRRYDWPDYGHYSREVLRLIAAENPDRIVVHNDLTLPGLLPTRLRSSTIVHVHNQVAVRDLGRARLVLSQVGAVVAVSDFISADIVRRFGQVRLSTIPNGVDAASFRLTHSNRTVESEPLRVAFLGRLLYDKGAHVLLDAVERLQAQGLALKVSVIGSPDFYRSPSHDEDPYVRRVRHRIDQLGGQYIPHLDRREVPGILGRQDILVVPSLFPEPFGLVVLEGMAAGCVVLASDIGGLPASVGSAGHLFPPGDADALADLLRRLAERPRDRRLLIAAGKKRAESYDWSCIAIRWLPLLEAL